MKESPEFFPRNRCVSAEISRQKSQLAQGGREMPITNAKSLIRPSPGSHPVPSAGHIQRIRHATSICTAHPPCNKYLHSAVDYRTVQLIVVQCS